MKNTHQVPQIPSHIAVIMDGNRRWARERGLPTIEGHRQAATKILEPLIEHASELGVKYMTFWAWSTENWGRTREELDGIMMLFRHMARNRVEKLHENGVRIRTIGYISKFPADIHKQLLNVVEKTKNNSKITVVFALNYGGRDEIVRAVNKIANLNWQNPNKSKISNSKTITKEDINNFLDTAGIPDPELLIRTGGEQRLSGFLLWQLEYTELYFPPWYMPDFTPERLDEAIEEFNKRKRRFGK